MSVSDELMWRYIELLSFESLSQIQTWKDEVSEGRNPRDVKVVFAKEIVDRFHGVGSGEQALIDFELKFKQGGVPNDIPEKVIETENSGVRVTNALKSAGLVASTSEAMRSIQQGGVRVNGEKLLDKSAVIPKGDSVVLQVGKRKFARILVK